MISVEPIGEVEKTALEPPRKLAIRAGAGDTRCYVDEVSVVA